MAANQCNSIESHFHGGGGGFVTIHGRCRYITFPLEMEGNIGRSLDEIGRRRALSVLFQVIRSALNCLTCGGLEKGEGLFVTDKNNIINKTDIIAMEFELTIN